MTMTDQTYASVADRHMPRTEVQTVTPELAETYLGGAARNRNINAAAVARLSRSLTIGEWILNGEAIKFDAAGHLLDGQHRLLAIIASGVPMETMVAMNVAYAAQATMDSGRARSIGDILQIRGETNARVLGSVLRRLVAYSRSGIEYACADSGGKYEYTNGELIAYLEDNPWVRDSLPLVNLIIRNTPLNNGPTAAMDTAFRALPAGADDADYFWGRLVDGVGLSERDPILSLRNAYNRITLDQRVRVNHKYLAGVTIKAWNLFRDGGESSRIQFRVGGANPEPFPLPR